ncbi:MAG: bifunctional phosphoglucose/phosphomannose isomerase [Chloroflexi bacterium]|nr:bifunctional phosphoglucose/phosphomannose isomerase [Chloroflexota bacterium]
MVDLDDLPVYPKLDPSGMRVHLRGMAAQCVRAWERALAFPLPADYALADKVLVLGMGGSAIGADLVAGLVRDQARGPLITHRGYGLPSFVDARTLVVASSYSGATEETLSGFQEALDRPCPKLALTTGGPLLSLARERGVPVFEIDYLRSPPRAALAYSLMPLLAFLYRMGFIPDPASAANEMVALLEGLAPALAEGSPAERNPAKQLAQHMAGRTVVAYGAGFLSAAARRFKTQVNENAKGWAFYESLPELNHNAVVGYSYPTDAARHVCVVMFNSPLLSEPVRRRYEVTAELLSKAGQEPYVLSGQGQQPLAQMMSLVLLGDYASYYLALLNGVDPYPVPAVDYLKRRLAER